MFSDHNCRLTVVSYHSRHLFFNFTLAKLYTNSLLSSLNSRGGWKFMDSTSDHNTITTSRSGIYTEHGVSQHVCVLSIDHDVGYFPQCNLLYGKRSRSTWVIILEVVLRSAINICASMTWLIFQQVFIQVESHEMMDQNQKGAAIDSEYWKTAKNY